MNCQKYIDSAFSPIIITDNQFNIQFWNASAEEKFEMTGSDGQNKHFFDLVSNLNYKDAKENTNTDFSNLLSKYKYLKCLDKEGSEFLAELRIGILENEGESKYSIALRDITDKETLDLLHTEIVSGKLSGTGRSFFNALTHYINLNFGMDYVRIGLLNEDEVTTISICEKGEIIDNYSYLIKDTPCEYVKKKSEFCYYNQLKKNYGYLDFVAKNEYNIYLGIPLVDVDKNVIGIISFLNKDEIENVGFLKTVLQLLAVRTGAEISRENSKTEQENLQKQLFQSQKLESIGQLASGIAHDYNNVMTGILGYAELLKISMGENIENDKKFLEILIKGVDRASILTKQLMTFARKGDFKPIPLDVNAVIKDILKVSEKILNKNIDILLELSENVKNIEADTNQIGQILTNLVINSRDAMPSGGNIIINTYNYIVDVEKSEQFGDIEPGEYVKISVSDSGTGMPKDVIEHIFEAFYTTKDEGAGTGLGLANVFKIVKNHKGHINVYSEVDVGTTFNIYLPATDKQINVEDAYSHIVKGSGTILVVDDEVNIRGAAEALLENLGYEIMTAADGFEALEIYKEKMNEINFILLDVVMPYMDGNETAEKLFEINPNIKIVAMSGYSFDRDVQSFLSNVSLAFIEKPFTLAELSKVFNSISSSN